MDRHEFDEELNRSHTGGREGLISREGSGPSVYVIPTDEELLIARDTVRLCIERAAAFVTAQHRTLIWPGLPHPRMRTASGSPV